MKCHKKIRIIMRFKVLCDIFILNIKILHIPKPPPKINYDFIKLASRTARGASKEALAGRAGRSLHCRVFYRGRSGLGGSSSAAVPGKDPGRNLERSMPLPFLKSAMSFLASSRVNSTPLGEVVPEIVPGAAP